MHSLVSELSVENERFRQLWARHEVRTAHDVTFRIRHPQVGPLELLVQKFHVPGPYSWKPCCSTPHRAAHRHTLLLFWQPSTTRNAELDQVAVRPRAGLLP
ncbi:MmyB family transcriptional regulator [Streptomyces griseofuscus]|uniref:MmyB family transcriptional regulator n=1 Tax=Streptomyces griseofuscus TaxID=146922 RepID=UPI003402C853